MKNKDLADVLESKIGAATAVRIGRVFAEEIVKALRADSVGAVQHGRWLNFVGDYSTAECSECGQIYEVSPDENPCTEYFDAFKQCYCYCPNCGAKMDAPEKEDD